MVYVEITAKRSQFFHFLNMGFLVKIDPKKLNTLRHEIRPKIYFTSLDRHTEVDRFMLYDNGMVLPLRDDLLWSNIPNYRTSDIGKFLILNTLRYMTMENERNLWGPTQFT